MAKKTVKKAAKKGTTSYKKFIKWFWMLFCLAILTIALPFVLAATGALGDMPDHTVLENPKTDLAAEIISADGKTLGKFYLTDNRTPVEYEDLSKHLVDNLVATEDERFYEHSGIDFKRTLSAILFMGTRGGGSTITQQLAKLLYHQNKTKDNRIVQKIKEYVIATRLERQYTKEEIITMYYNIYDFGNNGDGIRSAARIYFGKEPKNLDVEESAMLVGMFKNSSLYNPIRNPKGVKNRTNVVFKQMARNGLITPEQKDSLQKLPLKLNFTPETHNAGLATYFREHLRSEMHKWIKEHPKEDGEKYSLYKDGLKIYTTIDSRMQEYAENAVTRHMKNLQNEFDKQNKKNKTAPFRGLNNKEIERSLLTAMKRSERYRVYTKELKKSKKEALASFNKKTKMRVFSWKGDIDTIMTPKDSIRYYKKFFRTGLLSIEPQTGHVKAWVGGINQKHFKYDHAKQGKRQVGSTFKPFLYATAIDQLKYSPCEVMQDAYYCIPEGRHGNLQDWCPKNSNGKYSGDVTLKKALANSINTISARLMDEVGPKNVIKMANNLGVTSEIQEFPSIALGTVDLSLYEMVNSYSTLANMGQYIKPSIILRIEDKNGAVLDQMDLETKDVLSKESAYVTLKLMEGVTQNGSGVRLRSGWTRLPKLTTGFPYKFTNPIAGKTGTTQNQSDGWFMGVVPNLVTGVWVGAEDRAVHFSSVTYGQGATMALPIWALYMKDCYNNKDLGISDGEFEKPENLRIEVDCKKFSKNADDNDPNDIDLGI
ncbi:penicillin-binding protein 1A [Pseudofulvibacter geojedonensis]|uniref:Penicillin-binding protein 1A n=1 Tax=Pseudofulvibacter geojedonensis TaxID=1123758 RepID=A0ABW3I029_9FLAO